MKRLLIPALLVGFISGCYTQLLTDQPSMSPPPVQKISYIVDTVTKDTIKVLHQVDTVAARDNRNCYWVRNAWGQSELRCDNSYYSNYSSSWNMYNNYPWWYERDLYGGYYGGSYYHHNWYNNAYYGSYYSPYYYSGYTGGHGSPSNVNSGNGSLRRTSSSAVSRDNPSAPESKNMRAEPPPPAQTMQNTAPPSPPAGSSNGTNDNNHRRTPPRDW
jgi:hypothetical protein